MSFIESLIAAKAGGGSGGASSWNDLTDKPFYEEVTETTGPLDISWDGDTTGKEIHAIGADSGATMYLCRISDAVLTLEDLSSGTLDFYSSEDSVSFVIGTNAVPADLQEAYGVEGAGILLENNPLVVSLPADCLLGGVDCSAGTYFLYGEYSGTPVMYVTRLSNPDAIITTRDEVIHKLDNKYLDLDWIPKETTELLYSGTMEYTGSPVTGYPLLGLADGDILDVTIDGETVRCTALTDDGAVGFNVTTASGVNMALFDLAAAGFSGFSFSANGTYSVKMERVHTAPLPDKFLPNALGTPIFDLREYGLGLIGYGETEGSVSDTNVSVIVAQLNKGPVFLSYEIGMDGLNENTDVNTILVIPYYADGSLRRWAIGFENPGNLLLFWFGETSFSWRRYSFATSESSGIVVKSSTYGSTKQFKITVDDSGTLSATEVTEG